MDPEQAETLRLLTATRDDLLAACRPLAPADWARSDGPGRWTAAQVLEHLVIIEQRVAQALEQLLAQPPDPDALARTAARDARLPDAEVVREKIIAPPPAQPQGGRPPEALLADFAAARDRLLALANRPPAELKQHTRVHPVFGELNPQQWLRLTAHHTVRHTTQLRRCLAASA